MKKEVVSSKRFILVATIVIAIVAFLAGVITTYLITTTQTDRLQQKYNFLAKRVLVRNPNDILLNVSSLKADLNQYIQDNNLKGQIGLYFEYLPSGASIGINKSEQLVGASLLKTPLAVNLYKAAEDGKINLDSPITLKKDWLNSQYGELYKKGAGYQLTLRQAAEIMLRDSDNTAALAIYDSLSKVVPLDTQLLSFIDIDYSVNKDTSVKLSAESYSNILKCLYFSCYDNKDSSQQMLTYLSESNDSSRLKLFLPNDVVLAHKIGTFDSQDVHIQSDCGIFYVPNRNYLLCIMVKGDDPQASRVIGDLSQKTYDFVTSKN